MGMIVLRRVTVPMEVLVAMSKDVCVLTDGEELTVILVSFPFVLSEIFVHE